MSRYDDIINLPHYRSKYRMPMPLEHRAAQFAPFAALSGHDTAISETSRLTNKRIELTNEEKLNISNIINESHFRQEKVKISYFIPDKTKPGGSYDALKGLIVKVDEIDHFITLDNGQVLQMDDIISISYC